MKKNNIILKQIRENQNLTQNEISDVLKVSRSIIAKIERGEVELSENILDKLQKKFPNEFGLVVDRSEGFGNGSVNDILIERIEVNLSNISQVKFLLKEMCIKTSFNFNESLFLKCFISTEIRLKLDEYLKKYNNDKTYEYRFLLDFCTITKECLFSAYEDLFNFASVKYIYNDKAVQKKMIKELENVDIDIKKEKK